MLTREQIRYKYIHGGLAPCFIHPPEGGHQTQDYGFVYDFTGKVKDLAGRPLMELDKFIMEADHDLHRGTLSLGSALKKILSEHFLAAPDPAMAEDRQQILLFADRQRDQCQSFDDYIAMITARFGDAARLRDTLYGDLELLKPIRLINPLTPQKLIDIYNIELAATMLWMSVMVRFQMTDSVEGILQLIKSLKLWGLFPDVAAMELKEPKMRLHFQLDLRGSDQGQKGEKKGEKAKIQKHWRKFLSQFAWPKDFDLAASYPPRPSDPKTLKILRFSGTDLPARTDSQQLTTAYPKVLGCYKNYDVALNQERGFTPKQLSALVSSSPRLGLTRKPFCGFVLTQKKRKVYLDLFDSPPPAAFLEELATSIRPTTSVRRVEVIWLIPAITLPAWMGVLSKAHYRSGVYGFRLAGCEYGVSPCENLGLKRELTRAIDATLVEDSGG